MATTNNHHTPSSKPQPPSIYFPGQPENTDTGPGLSTQDKLELLTQGIESRFGDGLMLTPYIDCQGNARVKIAVDMIGDLSASDVDTLDLAKEAIAQMIEQVAAKVRGIDGEACGGMGSVPGLDEMKAREKERLRWIESVGLPGRMNAEAESCGEREISCPLEP